MSKNYEALQCNKCGELDSIVHDGDYGISYCKECNTPENYMCVDVTEDGDVLGTERELC